MDISLSNTVLQHAYSSSRCFRPRRNPFPMFCTALTMLSLLACAATTMAAGVKVDPDRATAVIRTRFVLVKALGQGSTPQEAEEHAFKEALRQAALHLEALGGAQAMPPGPEGQRVISLQHFKKPGSSQERTVLLLELRLRGQAEPLPEGLRLPVVRASIGGGLLTLSASQTCEAVAALSSTREAEPQLFPGGGQVFHLTPGKPVLQPLPHAEGQFLNVLACTGGLNVPLVPGTVDEVFTKSRSGSPRPVAGGVLSDCIELQLGRVKGEARAMRQKAPEAPVNMTGAAGRDASRPELPSSAP